GSDGRIMILSAALTGEQMGRLATPRGQVAITLVDDAADPNSGALPPADVLAQPYATNKYGPDIVRREAAMASVHFDAAAVGPDMRTGAISIKLRFSAADARDFCHLTSTHIDQRIAILLDGQVLVAATIRGRICDGQGEIVGDFTPESAAELA